MLNEDEEGTNVKKKVPKGTSEYQAAWILDEQDDSVDENSENSEEENEFEVMAEDDSEECVILFTNN